MRFGSALLALFLSTVLPCTLLFALTAAAQGEDGAAPVPEEISYEDYAPPEDAGAGAAAGAAADDGFANMTWKTVTFYLSGETSVEPLGGGGVKVKYGQLNTTKPNQSQDTSVPCPSMYGKIPKQNTFYIVGGFATNSFLGNVSRWGMNVELWAAGRAKNVQFMIVKGQEGYVTEEKDVNGPTKFTLTYLGYKEKSAYSMDFLIYYRTPQLQIPPSVSLIYGTPEHNANLKTNITSPMKAQYKDISVSGNKATFTAVMWDAFGMYDLASYSLNIRGPQVPKRITELSRREPGLLYNITYEAEYEKADGGVYTMYFVCTDKNGNTWITNRSDNCSFVLTQSAIDVFGYPAVGITAVVLVAAVVWYKYKRPRVRHGSKNTAIETSMAKQMAYAKKTKEKPKKRAKTRG